jgi:predicted TIM-barrel fold metal-dependent hydrolase
VTQSSDGTRVQLGALVDHHCHGLVTTDLDRATFEAMMNEADGPSPLGTTTFDSMLGVAMRRWCAPELDLEPHATAEDYLARRRELGASEVNRRLLTAAGISTFLVDTGLDPGRLTTPAELAAACDGRSREVVRLEAVGQQVLDEGTAASGFAEEVRGRLLARVAAGAVAAKSIAAYRVGLGLPARRPTDDELAAALSDVRPQPSGGYRIAHPVVNAWLAWTAVELRIPLQFHVAYGDSDVDLAECDPLRLTAFLRATQERGVPVLLLHNYPFHRNAAYLAQVFDHVFMDLGLATHNTGALSVTLLRETLELVPFGKLHFSSDAYGLAELYHLGALLFRRGLGRLLDGLVDDGEMSGADAEHVGRLVCRDNALRAYRLDGADVAG